MIRMTKELVDSFRKGGLKYRLQRDEDGLWSVRTDKQVFSGTEAGAVEFLKSKGIEAVSEPSKEVHTVGGNEFAEEPELEVVAVLEEADSFEEDNKLVIEARKGKEAEIAALKAKLAELEE